MGSRTAWLARVVWIAGCVASGAGCGAPSEPLNLESAPRQAADEAVPGRDTELEACVARADAVSAGPRSPGADRFDRERTLFLGRARGAMTMFVRAPAETNDDALPGLAAARERFAKEERGMRIARLLGRHKHDRPLLRALLLREGYLYSDDPVDAFELDTRVRLSDLFDAPRLTLERGVETFELERKASRAGGGSHEYVFASGPRAGRTATVLFADRVRAQGDEASAGAPPLHRDVVDFAHRAGFDRLEVEALGEHAMTARLRFHGEPGADDTWARAVIESRGARLELGCLAEPALGRLAVAQTLEASAWRRRAEAAMRAAVSELVDDALPFDRPREEEGPDRDGMLRPYWMSAYLTGRTWFDVEEKTYPVFDPDGRPKPPAVCVDFVVDTFERGAGSWFRPRGEKPGRSKGRLEFASFGEGNRRAVLGFGSFAESRPDLFDTRKFEGDERIPFARRDAYFGYLREHADDFRPGDVVAIQGLKRDERVHQHAILIEDVDPITGFPAGLADQMKLPRRRTWEGIMAEAPKRSLLYRTRPREVILRTLDASSVLK